MAWQQTAQVDGRIEKSTFFGEPGRSRFGVVHEPDGAAARQDPILVCHPHFEEKLWAHRILVNFARAAASRGHHVLRFDLSGQGDSAGEIEQFTFEDLEEDVDEAMALLQAESGMEPLLVGLRLGGLLAGRAAGRHGTAAVLWEPVLDPMTWVQEVLRINLAYQLRHHGKVLKKREDLVRDLEEGREVQIEGYGLTPRFFSQLVRSRGLQGPGFPDGCRRVLGISIRKRAGKQPPPLERAVAEWKSSTVADHVDVRDEPFWGPCQNYRTHSPELEARTLDWIEAGNREPSP